MSKELCYVGDPCYVIHNEDWSKVVETFIKTKKGDLSGNSFFMCNTYHGDGYYELMDARGAANLSLGVDSGTLAAIPLRIFPPAQRDQVMKSVDGAIVEIDLVNCSEEDGKFTFDQYTVDTKPIELIEEYVPVELNIYYTFATGVDIKWLEEKLGVKWSEIHAWWVKYDTFFAVTEDGGEELSVELDTDPSDNIDWKYPGLIRVYDKNHQCIEERD